MNFFIYSLGVDTTNQSSKVNDSIQFSFPKCQRFQVKRITERKQSSNQINPGIYVVRNTHTGHTFFGSTWDLENAKKQNFQDLQLGRHENRAMVRAVQVYGFKTTTFQILQTIPTPKEFHFRELENTLTQRLAFFIAKAHKVHARKLFNQWQLQYFTFAWPMWKAHVVQTKQIEYEAATIEIQRVWRGLKGRLRAIDQRHFCCATLIQWMVRGFLAHRCLLRLRLNRKARTIQHVAKRFLQLALYKRWKAGALLIQRVWRGVRDRRYVNQRRILKQQNQAAFCLQRNLRLHQIHQKWLRQRRHQLHTKASIVIQSNWRGFHGRQIALAKNILRKQQRAKNAAARLIQESYHEYQVKKFQNAAQTIYCQKRMAVRLSVYWHNFIARKFGWAALQIHLEHKMAIKLQQWAHQRLSIKRIHRGCLQCKRIRRAICIQRNVRGFLARHIYVPRVKRERELKIACNYIGRWYRSLKWHRLVCFLFRTKVATQIQALFRGYVVWKHYQECKDAWKEEKAALTIQKQYRKHIAMLKFQHRVAVLKAGACAECGEEIATLYSMSFEMELCHGCWSTIKGFTGTTDDKSIPIDQYRLERLLATKLAAVYRGYAARLLYKVPCCSNCTTASRLICLECPLILCHSCSATVHTLPYNIFHHPWRLAEHERRLAAAIRLQTRIRCFLERNTLQQLRDAMLLEVIIKVQGWWRTRYARHLARVLQEQTRRYEAKRQWAAGIIQRNYRGHMGCLIAKEERRYRQAVITIQSQFRAAIARRKVAQERQRRLHIRRQAAALVLQCAIRQYFARQDLRRRREFFAALRIQCTIRVYLAKQVLLALQIEYERKFQLAIEQVKYQRKVRAVIRIQSQYRRRRDFRVAVAKRLANTKARREHWERVCLLMEKSSAKRLQQWYRRRIERLNALATRIQCMVRCHVARRVLGRHRANAIETKRVRAAVCLQCFSRRIIARRIVNGLRAEKQVVENLPKEDAWIECLDESSGYTYYYNPQTQATTWTKPNNTVNEVVEKVDAEPQDTEWIACWDDSYQAYYFMNKYTGDTKWEDPTQASYEWYYDENGQVVYYQQPENQE
ncbi:hypothetical protein THRCLA_04635 [Thraustotheca clavata]|uniref:WW domain-containing protein n=1 Tax=Thraustotheca clavata TaxID=74557 RepID=A0A1V9ZYE8_9STRA|nr:hypothetical protein THRCLA_04635 [Thraustotheca clavata]